MSVAHAVRRSLRVVADGDRPPATRAGCAALPRPCSRSRCKHWLPRGDDGCVLDRAEQGPAPVDEVAELMDLSPSTIERCERVALWVMSGSSTLREFHADDDDEEA